MIAHVLPKCNPPILERMGAGPQQTHRIIEESWVLLKVKLKEDLR